jgi:hypothetical protein
MYLLRLEGIVLRLSRGESSLLAGCLWHSMFMRSCCSCARTPHAVRARMRCAAHSAPCATPDPAHATSAATCCCCTAMMLPCRAPASSSCLQVPPHPNTDEPNHRLLTNGRWGQSQAGAVCSRVETARRHHWPAVSAVSSCRPRKRQQGTA